MGPFDMKIRVIGATQAIVPESLAKLAQVSMTESGPNPSKHNLEIIWRALRQGESVEEDELQHVK